MSKRANYRVNVDGVAGLRGLLAAQREFNRDGATMTGRKVTGTWPSNRDGVSTDQLPQRWSAGSLEKALAAGHVRYIVYSYRTPIAWLIEWPNGLLTYWVQPDVKYSPTTSKHQGRVRAAVSALES